MEKIPVPKFFWKIAYDEKTKKGIAVIGTNNIHRTEEKICTPIDEEIPWLKFLDNTDITSGKKKKFIPIEKIQKLYLPNFTIEGPVYCCSVESFLSGVEVDIGVELDISGGLLL